MANFEENRENGTAAVLPGNRDHVAKSCNFMANATARVYDKIDGSQPFATTRSSTYAPFPVPASARAGRGRSRQWAGFLIGENRGLAATVVLAD